MNIKYRVDLSDVERTQLTALLNGGKHAARKIKRAQILLAADAGVGDEVGPPGGPFLRNKALDGKEDFCSSKRAFEAIRAAAGRRDPWKTIRYAIRIKCGHVLVAEVRQSSEGNGEGI